MRTIALVVMLCMLAAAAPQSKDPADQVNPLIGTAGDGQTFPAAGTPFGMTQWTPQTRDGEAKCIAPYYEKDTRIQGFRGSHFPSGSCTQEYGSVTVMALAGDLKLGAAERASGFQRSSEKARPYRYDVTLDDSGITASVAASSRAGILRFRFTKAGQAWILVQANSRRGEGQVRIDAARREISGFNPVHRLYAGAGKPAGFSGYFVARFDRPIGNFGVWSGGEKRDGATEQDGTAGCAGCLYRVYGQGRHGRAGEGRHVVYEYRRGAAQPGRRDTGLGSRTDCRRGTPRMERCAVADRDQRAFGGPAANLLHGPLPRLPHAANAERRLRNLSGIRGRGAHRDGARIHLLLRFFAVGHVPLPAPAADHHRPGTHARHGAIADRERHGGRDGSRCTRPGTATPRR